ncbi:hypothetical protein [Flavobacterium sp. GCM10027622]|uniref:hypothetical protein n=1 Tax=unclassified Flavobacterium TaxID=196869 RepID=UPI003620D093
MTYQDFELTVGYNSWNVEVNDRFSNLVNRLTCKSNSFFSNYISGKAILNDNEFSIHNSNKGILLALRNSPMGRVSIVTQNPFHRCATIEMDNETFFFTRATLQQRFEVTDKDNKVLLTIDGQLVKEKQKNLFGLVYFADVLYHSVYVLHPMTEEEKIAYLLLVCGYSIRVFLAIDSGDYSGTTQQV